MVSQKKQRIDEFNRDWSLNVNCYPQAASTEKAVAPSISGDYVPPTPPRPKGETLDALQSWFHAGQSSCNSSKPIAG